MTVVEFALGQEALDRITDGGELEQPVPDIVEKVGSHLPAGEVAMADLRQCRYRKGVLLEQPALFPVLWWQMRTQCMANAVCGGLRNRDTARVQREAFTESVVGHSGAPGGGQAGGPIRQSWGLKQAQFGSWFVAVADCLREAAADAAEALGLALPEQAGLEMQLTATGDGGYYLRHLDNGREAEAKRPAHSRLLTYIAYLRPTADAFSGGDLLLHDGPHRHPALREGFTRIEPLDNRVLFFRSFGSPHEITTTRVPSGQWAHSRFTLNGWFRDGSSISATGKAST